MKLNCKFDSSLFSVVVDSTATVEELKEKIKKKKKNDLAHIDADKLILARVFTKNENATTTLGVKNTLKLDDLVTSVSDSFRKGTAPELVEQQALFPVPGFEWKNQDGTVFAKVMNSGYKISRFNLNDDESMEGTVDIIVIFLPPKAKDIPSLLSRTSPVVSLDFTFDVTGEFFKVSNTFKAFDEIHFERRVYVRPAYRLLLDKIEGMWEEFADSVKTDQYDKVDYPMVGITGTPGIGKSTFLLWIIAHFQREKPEAIILYHHHFLNDSCFIIHRGLVEKVDKINSNFKCDYYLVDSIKPMQFNCLPKVVGVASPDAYVNHFKNVLKEAKGLTMYMPLWSLKELETIATLSEDFLNRYEIVGGVPRKMFATVGRWAEILNAVNDAATSSSIEDVKRSLSISSAIVKNPISDHIVYMDVLPGFADFRFKFASQYVENLVVNAWERQLKLEVEQFLISDNKHSAGLRGQLFERLVHDEFQKGQDLECRLISEAENSEIQIEEVSIDPNEDPVEVEEGTFESLKDNVSPSNNLFLHIAKEQACKFSKVDEKVAENAGRYMMPKSKTFCGVDAFVSDPVKRHLYMFQMTVSLKHPIKLNGINALLKVFPGYQLFLIFVIPRRNERYFRRQRICSVAPVKKNSCVTKEPESGSDSSCRKRKIVTLTDGNELDIIEEPRYAKKITQYVVGIELCSNSIPNLSHI